MRLFASALTYVQKHGWPEENKRVRKKLRELWFFPIASVDLIYAIIKTNGDIELDWLWMNITDTLFMLNETEILNDLYELEDSYRKEVLGKEA